MDAAALAIKIDSSSVVQATKDLDQFSAAAGRAGASVKSPSSTTAKMAQDYAKAAASASGAASQLGNFSNAATRAAAAAQSAARAVQQADAHVLAYRDSLNKVSEGAGKASTAIKFTAQDSLNASRQLADIGVTAASGMSPFLIALQQGPQLFDILQEKAINTGTRVGTVFRAAAASVLAAAAPFLPWIALLALAAAGLAALTAQANDDSGLKKYTTAMGYTKEEVKKLNSVTVTFGDTTKAVFQAGLSSVAAAMGITTKDMSKIWDSFLDRLVSGTRATLAAVYAAFAGMKAYLGEIEKGGITGLAKMAIGQGDPKLLEKTFGAAYADGQKGLDALMKQAQKNALTRQTTMAKGFYDKPSTPKGGGDTFTYSDLLKEADKTRNDLTKAGAQIGVYGEALARVTYEQDLLNKASERGLKLSPTQRTAIAGIAAELAKLSEANRTALFMENFRQESAQQVRSLEQAKGAIGLIGAELIEYNTYQDAVNKALAAHIILTDADRAAMRKHAAEVGAASYSNTLEFSKTDNSRWHNEQMRQLEVQRGAIGLTEKALISYNYQQEMINKSLAAGVQFADLDIEAIRRKGDAYAMIRTEIEKQAKAVADAREITGGFFREWIDGVRQGQNVFKAFSDSVLNGLNRLIDKLLDRTLNGFLDTIAGSGSSNFLTSILGGKTPPISPNALGGIYASPMRFGAGAAFTNTVVNTPTLFRFANGAALGEMGERGPEGILPLSRDSKGRLGVHANGGGGRPSIRLGDVHVHNSFAGAIGIDAQIAMHRETIGQAVSEMRRQLESTAAEYQTNGSIVS